MSFILFKRPSVFNVLPSSICGKPRLCASGPYKGLSMTSWAGASHNMSLLEQMFKKYSTILTFSSEPTFGSFAAAFQILIQPSKLQKLSVKV